MRRPFPIRQSRAAVASLLAVDLGLRTGLALYGKDGRLRWYRSQNFGSKARLRRGARGILEGALDLALLVLEGGDDVANLWQRAAERRSVPVHRTSAEQWRRRLLHPRQRRTGAQAKAQAGQMARRIIAWSEAAAPTSLRHDAAEAICIGLWAALALGWLDDMPASVRG